MPPTKQLEVRSAALGPIELRAAEAGLGTLHGYAAVFNRYSQNLGGFVERIDPAAFNKSLGDDVPVLCRYNHDDNYLLGTTEGETLRLGVDGTGLAYDVDLPDTSAGRDTRALAQRGDLRYSSFAFYTIDDEWSVTEQGFPLRTLLAVQLVDVAPVNNPAYRDTSVAVRSLAARAHVDVEEIGRMSPADVLAAIAAAEIVDETGEEDLGARAGAPSPSLALRMRQLELDRQR